MDLKDLIVEDFDEPTPIKITSKSKECSKCKGKLLRVIYEEPTDKTWELIEN